MAAKDEVEAEDVDSTYPVKGTQNFGKRTEAIKEPLEEGGASTPNKIDEQRHLLAIIAAKSAIAKRSTEKEEVSRPRQAYKSYAVCLRLSAPRLDPDPALELSREITI